MASRRSVSGVSGGAGIGCPAASSLGGSCTPEANPAGGLSETDGAEAVAPVVGGPADSDIFGGTGNATGTTPAGAGGADDGAWACGGGAKAMGAIAAGGGGALARGATSGGAIRATGNPVAPGGN